MATVFGLATTVAVVMMMPLRAQEIEGQADWPSYNLDLAGSRYAELDAINTANVNRLELIWSLKTEAENVITQVTPLVVSGVMYFNDATGTAFAVDPATGEALWTTDLGGDTSRIVSRPRGPSYGDGRLYVFFGVTMFALDAATGALVESFGDGGRLEMVSEALHAKYPDQYPRSLDARTLGHQITTPPTYYQDTLYVGVGLSDQHIPGGLLIAADATTGAIKWVFNTVPQGPTDDGWEIAKDTWGTGIRAGGGIWTTPAIDPELGLVYVNTGNPSADYDGSARPGINLFTNATLAVELETGPQ